MPSGNVILTATSTPTYKVNYYRQKLGCTDTISVSNYQLVDTYTRPAIAGEYITPDRKSYIGFTYKTILYSNSTMSNSKYLVNENGNTVISVYYSRNNYNVTLNKGTGIGEVTGDGSYQYEESVTIAATPETDYDFEKWTGSDVTITSGNKTNKTFTFTMPAEDVEFTAYAKMDFVTYTVRYWYQYPDNFNDNIHTSDNYWEVESWRTNKTVKAGSKITEEPLDIVDISSGKQCYIIPDSQTFTIDSNGQYIDFYYPMKKLTINFYQNNSTSDTTKIGSKTFTALGTDKTFLSAIDRVGYTQIGWAMNRNATIKQFSVGQKISTAYVVDNFDKNVKNLDVYALWNIHSSTIVVDGNTYGTVSAPEGGSKTGNYNTTQSIKVEPINYKATFNANGGSSTPTAITTSIKFSNWITPSTMYGSLSSKTTNPSTYTYGSSNGVTDTIKANYTGSYTITLPASITRTGYRFTGWKSSIDGTVYAANESVTLSEDTTFTAQWVANTYSITYHGNGGILVADSNETSYEDTATYNEIYKVKGNIFYKKGYYFRGWAESSTGGTTIWGSESATYNDANHYKEQITTYPRYDKGIYYSNTTWTETSDLDLYAIWTANPYTVIYNSNKPDGASSEMTGTMANSAFTYDISSSLRANSYSLAGYTFTGWNTKADGTGTSYKDKASVKNLTDVYNGKITLYAQWSTGTANYRVNCYLQNIGAGEDTTNASNWSLCSSHSYTEIGIADSTVTISASTHTGFKYLSGAGTYSIKANGTTVINLYYTRNKYTVTLNKGTGIASVSGDGTYQYGETVEISANTNNGYTWANWSGQSIIYDSGYSATMNPTRFTMPAANVTLTANARNNSYTVYLHTNTKPSNATNNIIKASSLTNWTWDDTQAAWKATFTYNVKSSLPTTENAFSLLGWSSSGWYKEATTVNCIGNGEKVWNLTSNEEDVHLYPKWTANKYQVVLNANKPSKASHEVIANTALAGWTYNSATNTFSKTFTYDGQDTLPIIKSVFSLVGWDKALGWYTNPTGGTIKNPGTAKWNLTTTNNGTVNLYPHWVANTYTLRLGANIPSTASNAVRAWGVTGWTYSNGYYSKELTYDTAYQLPEPISTYSLKGWDIVTHGWYTTQVEENPATNKYYAPGVDVSNFTTTDNGVYTLYARWNIIKSTLTYDVNAGRYESEPSKTIGGGTTTYKRSDLTGDNCRITYITCADAFFTGVQTPSTDKVISKDANLSISETHDYYSLEAGKSYFTTIDENGNTIIHAFVGWSVDPYATLSHASDIVHKSATSHDYVDLIYEYQAYLSVKDALSNDSGARMSKILTKKVELENKVVLDNNRDVIIYAIWDTYPAIEVNNRTIASSVMANMEKEDFYSYLLDIVDKENSSDIEDGNLHSFAISSDNTKITTSNGLVASFDDVNVTNALTILKDKCKIITLDGKDYATTGAATVTYKLSDKSGNTVNKVVEIWVVSQNPLVSIQQNAIISVNSYTRSITADFINEDYENGGLSEASIWKTGSYKTALDECLNILAADNGYEEVWEFTHADVERVHAFIENNGIGNSKSPTALDEFLNTFSYCRVQ